MAAPVYSTRFLGLAGVAAGTYSYTVPSGQIAVLRDVDALMIAPAAGVALFIAIAGFLIDAWVPPAAAWQAHQWRGRQVLHAGELLQIVTQQPGVYASCSGYLLTS